MIIFVDQNWTLGIKNCFLNQHELLVFPFIFFEGKSRWFELCNRKVPGFKQFDFGPIGGDERSFSSAPKLTRGP